MMKTAGRTHTARIPDFRLESGYVFDEVTLAYETFGTLNAERSNAVLIQHALTADSHVTSGVEEPARAEHPGGFAPGWWEELVGPGRGIDTEDWFVVCTNALGGCNGSTGPTSAHPDGLPYGSRFPHVTIRDMVHAEIALSDLLGIDRWHAVIGGSMGGARSLEWAVTAPERVEKLTVLAAPAYSDADHIAWAHTQINAIELDPDYCGGDYRALGRFPETGLGIARQIAHLTYRADAELNHRFGNDLQDPTPPHREGESYYAIQSYLDHQARKLVNRFDAESYRVLTGALRDHDVRRGRSADLAETLSTVTAEVQLLSISSDRLYTPGHVAQIGAALPGSPKPTIIPSWAGHDGFLTETAQLTDHIGDFLNATSRR
ncbi:homoserine O-acetyltransferase MetX [Brevibacterium litoralis]|uniref:homoserine O-acetyltransferase MetX n=1 Tax=Brevibacterium litoralis TaxID=3138935 RepID=UPI0032EE026A